jgi:L-ribulokinase
MGNKYSIGVDYGTLSGRAVLMDVKSGEIIVQAVKEYTHGVMDKYLPNGRKLYDDWALQHPEDYLEVLYETIPSVLEQSGVDKKDVIGISTDFTACTLMPVDNEGTPLCMLDRYADEPHAYVKLWKHHAAQEQANRLNRIARERGESFLKLYGGKISSEWLVPKVMQIVEEAPKVYESTYSFMEAADWITMKLCGKMARNTCTAGYKAIWNKKKGYPDREFFKAQWEDFDYKLANGESLREVQQRNISALTSILEKHRGKSIVVGTHGTALSTIINYFRPDFGHDAFISIIDKMPYIIGMRFDGLNFINMEVIFE